MGNLEKMSPHRASVSKRLFRKHANLTTITCCPNCHGDLGYQQAAFLSGVPFHGAVVCKKCGVVGQLANFKYYFNNDGWPNAPAGELEYSGLMTVTPLDLDVGMFLPMENWVVRDQQFFGEKSNSKFTLLCNGVSMALILLNHPWSGIAKIFLDGNLIYLLDLFEETGSIQMYYPIYLGGGDHFVEVEVTGCKNPRSKGSQVIVSGAEILSISDSCGPGILYDSVNRGNPYPHCFEKLVSDVPETGLVLDCGAGDRSHPDPRVVNFEYSRFSAPDVFGDGHKLPYKNNSFDLILSQAVMEHVYDPFKHVSELLRILKPGGRIYVESAFMQPLHSVPYHFFNTTGRGLQELFKDIDIIETKHHGSLSGTLEWFYNLTELRTKGLGKKIDTLLSIAKELDVHISDDELKYFSSFVSLVGKKNKNVQS